MRNVFESLLKKAKVKSYLSLILIGVLVFELALPNGMTPFAAELDSGTGSISAVSGSAIYVSKGGNDSNTGTSATDAFATINKAVSSLKDGDTLYIAAGTYNEPMNISGKKNVKIVGELGTNGEKNTIISGAGDMITDSGWGAGYPSVLAVHQGCDAVDISNITFDYTVNTFDSIYDSTVLVVNSTNVNIHNCNINAGATVSSCFQTNSDSLYTFDSNVLGGESACGFWFPWGANQESRITNNIVKNSTSISMVPDAQWGAYHRAGLIFENNTCLGTFDATNLHINTNSYVANNNEDPSDDIKNIIANNIFSDIIEIDSAVNIVDSNYEFATLDDVKFTNEAAGDYSITTSSPCNDTGSKQYEAATDFLGAPRSSATADIGAYQIALPDKTIYVDGTNGVDSDTTTGTSSQDAFKTIASGIAALQSGYTLHIASGTYDESLNLIGKSNITIVGEKDTIVSGSSHTVWTSWNDYPGVLNIDKCNSIDISNIHFLYAEDTENVGYDSTVFVVDSVNVKVHNCIIEAGETVSACVQTNSNSTSIYTFDSNILTGNSPRGFWVPWGVEVDGCQITNNIIHNATSIDMRQYDSTYKYSRSILVANNTCLGTYDASTLPDDKNTVANNIFAGNNASLVNTGVKTNNFVYKDISEVNFVDATNGDYHITAVSPCNDAGSAQYETSKDFLGAERVGASADIGAFQFGDVYYVSSETSGGQGTIDDPYSLEEALATLKPGDTAYLMAGWYAGMYDFSKYANLCGSQYAYIHITNYENDSVFIYGNSASNHAINATSINNYIDLSGVILQFDNDVAWRAGSVATLNGTTNFNIHDCTFAGGKKALAVVDVTNSQIYNNAFVDNANDIYFDGISNSSIFNNLLDSGVGPRIYNNGAMTNNKILNNVFAGSVIAIDANATSSATNNIIENNIFATSVSTISGTLFNAADNNTIDYNYFYDIPANVGTHNVTGDLYCNGSYHITSSDSVLFNKGDDIYAPKLDRDGNAREGISDIGMYEAIGIDAPEVIPEWGTKMTHPALLSPENINTVTTDLLTETDEEKAGNDEDAVNLGSSLENVWSNVVKATEGFLSQDYFLDSRNSRFCLYYPYMMQPVSWASTSSMQVGDATTANSYATRAVTGITESTYYVNFDFKPMSSADAKDYVVYASTASTDLTDVILKMSGSKLLISNGSSTEFVTVKDSTGKNDMVLGDSNWYNIYITVNKDGDSRIIVHPRGTTIDCRTNFTTFGTGSIDGMFIGCKGTAQGKAHFDNIRIYDTYVPVVDDGFSTLDNWTKIGAVAASNEAAYPSSKGSYNWTSINGDLQTILQNFAITYYVKKATNAADADIYYQKTKQMMLSIANWKKWGDPDEPEKGSLDIGYITTGMSYAYDLLYNDLTADERKIIAKAIKTKGVDVLSDANTDVSEYGYYDGVSTAPNTLYVQNAGLGLAALVVGDVYNTEDELAVARKNLDDSYAHGVDNDGAWIEGFIYGDLAVVYALPFHDADNRITGNTTINNNYLKKVVDYVIYNMFPGGKYYSNIADNALVESSYQYKKILEYYTKNNKSRYAAWALKRLGALPTSMDLLSLVWFPSGAKVVAPDESTVALGKVFNDMGVAALKTGWSTSDSLMTLKSSKLVANMQHHTHLDQNSIELMRGTSYLLCDPGYQSWSGNSRDFNYGSLGHNTLILDGSNQNSFGDSSGWTEMFGGQIENYFIGDKYGFSVGSAGLCYYDMNNDINTVPEWKRSIVDLIDSDYYVLFDDYQTNADNKNLVWQLLSKGEWSASTTNPNTMSVTIGNDQLSVVFINTDIANVKVDNTYGANYNYSDTHRIYTKLANGKENQNLLALLYPSAAGAALPTTAYLNDADDTGVVVTSGDTTDVVLFHKNSVEPVVLSGAAHSTALGDVTVEANRVNKVVIKYTATADAKLLQNGEEIGTLVGDGSVRVDSFVLNSASGSVTLSTSGSVSVSDVWSASTIKTDAVASSDIATVDTSKVITLPNPDSHYDVEISYENANDALVYQDGVIIGKLADGSGTSTIALQQPYTETMVDRLRTATASISLSSGTITSIKVAENESRHRIGKVLDVGDKNDKDYSAYNTPGMVVTGNAWTAMNEDGTLTYRSGSSGAQMYVNSPNTRNSYTVYIKYKADSDVPVYQYKSDATSKQIAKLESSSTAWKVASFDIKEYRYSATDTQDLVTHMLLQFGAAIDVESSWIELRESDNQVDYTDVGKTEDNSNVKHNPGLVIGENFAEPDSDARVSQDNGTIYANIADTSKNYYVNIMFKAGTAGNISQALDNAGNNKVIAEFSKSDSIYKLRFKLNGNYFDSNSAVGNTNVLLKIAGSITINEMWLEEETRTTYDTDLDEVDSSNSDSGAAFEPVKLKAYMPESNMNIDGVLSQDENWNLDMDIAYGVTTESDFAAKAGVKWDTNYFYIAAQVTDAKDYDASKVADAHPILDGDGLEVYIAKTRGQKVYDINTAQYVFSTLNGIFVGKGADHTDLTKVVKDGITYIVKRNDKGYVIEIAIPWQSIGGMTVSAGDKIGFTLHAFDKDTNDVPQNTIGLTEQYMKGDWATPFYWPELSLINQNTISATSMKLSTETATLNFAETLDLKAYLEPITSNDVISFTSSDENVAKVDKWGTVTGLSVGTATITATAGKVSAQCIVTVNPATDAKTISIKKTQYGLGDSLTVFYTGSLNPQWIGIYPATSELNGSYLGWSYASSSVKSGCVTIAPYSEKIPETTGKFKVVLFKDAGYTPIEGQSIEFDVVDPIGISDVTMGKSTLALNVGDEDFLTASVNDDTTYDKHVIWSSSDTSVAAVDQYGRIQAFGEGTATITATAYADGSKKATCAVTVSKNTEPTATPTPEPTATPTPTTTPEPTATPTPTTTPEPTATPTTTPEPTATAAPTSTPSTPSTPSATPTVAPTVAPTATPTPVVVESNKSKTDEDGNVSNETKAVLEYANGSKVTVNTEIVTNVAGEQTSAKTTINATPVVTTEGKTVTFAFDMPADVLLKQAESLKDGTTLDVTYKIPQGSIVSEIKKSNEVLNVVISQPTAISESDNINMSSIVLPKAVLNTLKAQGSELTITVQDENQKTTASWTFDGDALKDSKAKIADINLAVDINAVKNDTTASTILKKDTKNSEGIVVSLSETKTLPTQSSVKLYVGDQLSSDKVDSLYVYGVDAKSNKLLALPNNKYDVDSEGYITLNIIEGQDYVLLPNKASSKVTTSLLDQVDVASKATISAGNKKDLSIDLPSTLESVASLKDVKETDHSAVRAAKVSYKVSDTDIATIDSKGTLTAKKAGKVVVTTTVTLSTGKKQTYTTTVTVK